MQAYDVVVVGGGAAGLMAAFRAAGDGRRTLLLEKMPAPGRKILISGGGHCNVTHAATPAQVAAAFGEQGPFLRSALAALSPDALVDLLAAAGVPAVAESGGKVFPRSGRAADVLAALLDRLRHTACEVSPHESLRELAPDEAGDCPPLAPPLDAKYGTRPAAGFVLATSRRTVRAAKVILATGGLSYPDTGSSGDGYRWAAQLGHAVRPPRPALTPITTPAAWVRALGGISLGDAEVQVLQPAAGGRQQESLARQRGELLFAHFGVSGPAVLDVSRAVSTHPAPATLQLACDLLPGLTREEFDGRLKEACVAAGKRLATSVLAGWLPQRLAAAVARLAGVDPRRRAAELTRPERRALVENVKRLEIPVAGTMGFRKAEVTAGGVAREEVDSRTMQSKIVPGLYFAGEVLDIDGPIGGYNLQAAFSTGWLAGAGL